MRVLVVEDSVTQAESLAILLRSLGHTPLLAGNGQQGQQQVELHGCDVAIVDLVMPVMGGREFILWLRGRPDTAGVPVIVSTGLPANHEGLVGINDIPGVVVVQKPFDVASVLAAYQKV